MASGGSASNKLASPDMSKAFIFFLVVAEEVQSHETALCSLESRLLSGCSSPGKSEDLYGM